MAFFFFYPMAYGDFGKEEAAAIGPLLIIGGKEDKTGTPEILSQLVGLIQRTQRPIHLGVVTTASQFSQQAFHTYDQTFTQMGIHHIEPFIIESRRAANQAGWYPKLKELGALFFVGGDQLRITSVLGGTAFAHALKDVLAEGLIIAGTSAGAAMMSTTMIVDGVGDDIATRGAVHLVAGMGLWPHVVVDQHFTQRGRFGRLLSVLAQNPGILGVGIDEDTAILVDQDHQWLEVWGSQTVTLLDGWTVAETNAQNAEPSQPLILTGVTLHVLSKGYGFHLTTRQPVRVEEEGNREH